MDYRFENNTLSIQVSGRVDSSNSALFDRDIQTVRAEFPGADELILDAQNLEYISSAGLRVILRLLKECKNLRIINANSDVYDIFEITGFTEMLPVEKAYRQVNVEGCEVVGQGANGKVYRLDEETIIKVYLNPDSLPDIQRERELARKAFILGIPTAIPYDVVRVGDGYGSVFELLNSRSLGKRIVAEPEKLDEYIEIYVDLLKKIHSTKAKMGEFPDMRAVAIHWAEFLKDYIPADYSEKLIRLISEVPVDDHMMHGDYHVKNVMIQNGEALLIDMDTLCMGNPVFEFASMYNAFLGYAEFDHSVDEKFLGVSYETASKIWSRTLELYFNTTDSARLRQISDRARIVGYTRMIRRSIRRYGLENDKATIDLYISELEELLDRTDSILF